MRKSLTNILTFAALLTLAVTASAQTAAPEKPRAYALRTTFYTAPVKVKGGRTDIKIFNNTPPLDGGQMASAKFAEEMNKLEAEGRVTITNRQMTIMRAGETFQLYSGAAATVLSDVAEAAAHGRKIAPLTLASGEVNVHLEETTGGRVSLAIKARVVEPSKDGGAYNSSVETTVWVSPGETLVFVIGTSPDSKRQTFFAVSATPAVEKSAAAATAN